MESIKNKRVGSNFAEVKKEVDVSITEARQEVNTKVAEINGKMDMSLVKIKTEPDCDIAPATVHLTHQEVKSVDTMLTAIKEEIDSDTDTSDNNNVTVHLLIPETILDLKTEDDVQTSSEENLLAESADSDVSLTLSQLTETREDSIHSNASSDIIPENMSAQSVPIRKTKRQRGKPGNDSEFCDLESLAPPSSTNEKEPAKKRRTRNTGSLNAKTNIAVSDDNIDPESPTPHSSTELSEIVIGSEQSNKREVKGSKYKNRKEKEMVVCPFCDRKMVKHYFPYHARVHTDERPFKCPKCTYESRFKGPLNFHMESHHPTEGYLTPK
ncbi:transcriptional repressor CTCFL [Parasteatoda tepidariorum]|nr:transcriptional repressor CTCFL [Parasteatoda tepidariorum]